MVQSIIDASEFEVTYKEADSSEVEDLVSSFVRPFELSEEIPYRISLVDVSGLYYMLMIDSHHIINDGVSNDILIRDLWSLYQGQSLKPLNISYTDYSVWQESESYQEIV
ncbi:hypothetical protein F7018_17980, partial [Tenacibaculum aiptasiae]